MENEKLLYIHIPFCDSKCNYCAFNSYTNLNHLKKEYFSALKKDLAHKIENYQIDNFKTIFIGGGTPSTMSIEFYEKLFEFLNPYIKNSKEITIECNPNTSYEWLKAIKNLGINRISFGVQSFNEEKLKFLNRNHSSKQAIKSIENAKKAGFDNINLDLIYSTSVDNKSLLKNDLKITFSLPITHISAYSLTIENNTKWEGDYSKRKEDEELEIWFINKIKEKFTQYEISNFGKECLHNLGYWKLDEYIGVGAGAVGYLNKKWTMYELQVLSCQVPSSKLNGELRMENEEWNISKFQVISSKFQVPSYKFKRTSSNISFRYYTQNNVYEYIKNPTKCEIEYLTREDIKKEKVLLGLRSKVGFNEEILNEDEKQKVDILIKEKKLFKKENRIYSFDFLLADALSLFILT